MKPINKKMQDLRRKMTYISRENTSVDVTAKVVLGFQHWHDWLCRILHKTTDNIWDKAIL